MNIEKLFNQKHFQIDPSSLIYIMIDDWLVSLKPEGKRPIIKRCTIGYNLHSYTNLGDHDYKEHIRPLIEREVEVFESLLTLRKFYSSK